MNLWKRFKNLFQSNQKTTLLKSGIVKFFNRSKGYGFIQSEETTKEVFVHITELEDTIHKGDRVHFELGFSDKGLIAKSVQLA